MMWAATSVDSLHAVGDEHMRVQVRVKCSGVPVVELRRHRALCGQLRNACSAGARAQIALLHHGQRLLERGIMRGRQALLHRNISQAPRDRERLRR